MIQLAGAQKRYGPRILFEGVDWLVTPNERAGIVGANGTGKSSLLKVLAGCHGLDLASITTPNGGTIRLPPPKIPSPPRAPHCAHYPLRPEPRHWLEESLSSFPYAFTLVSHDRYFLDGTVRKIIELWNKGLHQYTGGYSKFETQKTERRAQLQAAYANQQDKIQQ